jgi:hypothetical protein
MLINKVEENKWYKVRWKLRYMYTLDGQSYMRVKGEEDIMDSAATKLRLGLNLIDIIEEVGNNTGMEVF